MNPKGLRQKEYVGLLVSQTLGALNDNLFRIIVSLLAIATVGSDSIGGYLTITTLIFTLPYIVFSIPAGRLADRFSKSSILKLVKAAEVLIAALALAAFANYGTNPGVASLNLLLFVLLLMAIQSAFFSPAKLSYLPEIVRHSSLTAANGALELSRYCALILGTGLGGVLLQHWSSELSRVGWSMLVIAIAGLVAISWLHKDSGRHPGVAPVTSSEGFTTALRAIFRDPLLTISVAGVTLFEALGTLVMLSLLLVAKELLNADDDATGFLAATLGMGIGLGSYISGQMSGPKIEIGLIPLAGIGLGISLLLLSISGSFYVVLYLSGLLGLFGGIFLVPLYAWIQHRSPTEIRGLVLATNNLVNMTGVLIASLLLWLIHDILAISTSVIFQISAVVIFGFLGVTLIACDAFRRRFQLLLRSFANLRLCLAGQEDLPDGARILLICPYRNSSISALVDFSFDRPIHHVREREELVELSECMTGGSLGRDGPGIICIQGRHRDRWVAGLLHQGYQPVDLQPQAEGAPPKGLVARLLSLPQRRHYVLALADRGKDEKEAQL